MKQMSLLEVLDSLSAEDRDKLIGSFSGMLTNPIPSSLLSRQTIKISNLGTPDEIRQRIADALGCLVSDIPNVNIQDGINAAKENWLAVKALTDPYIDFLKAIPKITKDKFEEVLDLGRFIIALDKGLEIIIPSKLLPYPDFIVKQNNRLIGIEHTRLVKPQSKAIINGVRQFIENAHDLLAKRNPNLTGTVNLFFDFDKPVIGKHNFINRRFTIAEKKQVAEMIADYIESTLSYGVYPKPSFISFIGKSPNPDLRLDIILGEKYIAKDGFKELLLERISDKEIKTNNYLITADVGQCWLLIVIDGVSSYSGFDLKTEVFPVIKESKFEKIILFETFSGDLYSIY